MVGLGTLVFVTFLVTKIVLALYDTSVEAEFGGIARPDSNGNWYVLDDAAHTPICLSSVTQTSTYVKINYCKTLSIVRWVIGNPDERLVQSDIDVGVSGVFDGAILYFTQNGSLVNPNTITSVSQPSANIWLYVRGQL